MIAAKRLAGLLALPLAACSLAPAYQRPSAPVPPSWPTGDAYLRQTEATLPSVTYRDIFHDARLQRLIDQALANNRDLRIAAANIAIARAQYRIQRADLFPSIDATAQASVARGGTSGTAGNGGALSNGGGVNDRYSVQAGVTAFELDLFGRVRSLSTAALDQYFATEAAARATRLALVGDVADAWLGYAADRSLLTIAENTVRLTSESVRLTRLRLEGGIVPRTDLRQAELTQAQAMSDVANLRATLAQDANLLRLLLGSEPDPALLPGSIEEAGATLAELPAGLDSQILLRRPDVVEAEYQLRAANAQIGAARAALFPRISMTGLLGFASGALGSLFTGDAFTWSASGGAGYSIFNAGAARAGVAQTQAQRDAALANYERSIQTAFREVADALARRGTIDAQLTAQTKLVAAATDNFQLATLRYRGGVESFLQNLDAQRSLYTAQRSLVATRLTRASNLVALYRTLGGDALVEATAAGPATPTPRAGGPSPN